MLDIGKFVDDLLSLAELGVKWGHQGRDPRIEIDCVGFIRWGFLQQLPALPVQLEREFDSYLRRPDGQHLLAVMRHWLDEVERTDRTRGNLLLIYDRKNPQHVAVVVNEIEVVEAYSSPVTGVEKVLRQRLDPRRIVAAAFRFPASGPKLALWNMAEEGSN